MALTIYHKACPHCAATVLVSANECNCGHRFADADAADTHDEELYTVYLAARVDQALVELGLRQAELTKSPGDFSRMTKVMRAVREAQAARDELETHRRQLMGPGNTAIDDTATTPVATQSAEPTPKFHQRQAAKAARIMDSGYVTGSKACPQCRASALPSTVRCRCGHFFQVDPPLPASLFAGNKSKNTNRHPCSDPGATPDPKR